MRITINMYNINFVIIFPFDSIQDNGDLYSKVIKRILNINNIVTRGIMYEFPNC